MSDPTKERGDTITAKGQRERLYELMRERAEKAEAERDALREALELCNGDDVRINGCACKPLSKCYLHGQIVAKALGLDRHP